MATRFSIKYFEPHALPVYNFNILLYQDVYIPVCSWGNLSLITSRLLVFIKHAKSLYIIFMNKYEPNVR